uniref:DUF6604 domain-containing protein n=1 Tax=Chromera velia CCMP2878 TaxID=1169474 RepID=A0A0G4FIB8_9ALVE|eukprot:Cvel_17144.t1-p1 / transcript=Cvel_17144.t1 / gene=Cvel_17144 / organism=Chromera_velia_CCMP2878 / gene_product=hypothetical protein / transcript_product=hypothetical protein / location=Cvel_scaffold1354:4669-11267(+) / protein_length=230 / sequence_SO=supercontig / SO=protein_coding / is_pseudo=false
MIGNMTSHTGFPPAKRLASVVALQLALVMQITKNNDEQVLVLRLVARLTDAQQEVGSEIAGAPSGLKPSTLKRAADEILSRSIEAPLNVLLALDKSIRLRTEVSMLLKDAEETPEGEAHSFFIYALDRLRQRLSPVGKHQPDSGEDPRHGEDLRKKQNTYVVLATHAQQTEGEDEQTEAVIDEDFPSVPSEMPSEWDVLPGRESKEFKLAMQALSLLLDLHELSVMVSNE